MAILINIWSAGLGEESYALSSWLDVPTLLLVWINENCYAMTFGGDYGYKEGYNSYCKIVR
jgi:hypothetical protein